MNHREETTAVKQALRAAGVPYRRVGHGTGTAWTWLHIYLGPDATHDQAQVAIHVAKDATGRRGDYDGKIKRLPALVRARQRAREDRDGLLHTG